jgi:UDP-N-acetyl-D-glucosamine/UDP-N-acetyl-D-galactosamine dehydrogenase
MRIAVVGLGYVGLPLAECFAKHFDVIGIDNDFNKINDLKNGLRNFLYSYDSEFSSINECDFVIVAVPTPVDDYNKPDLSILKDCTISIAKNIKKGAIIVYESTVFPGCTEEICIPLIEKYSSLKYLEDFEVGYSPERVNPGDDIHTISNTKKIISGGSNHATSKIAELYRNIIDAGLYIAPSIKVAEAAKVIENAQRDVNISFVNELALIFDKMGIDTNDVLDAAATKWNFLPFRPGLVGGHCISVDPYYLAYKSEQLGYVPEVILSGRRVNNFIGSFVAQKVVKLILEKNINLKGANVLILGLSFKENIEDVRNSKVVDMYKEFTEFKINVDIYDPIANRELANRLFKISLIQEKSKLKKYDAIVLAVAHDCFHDLSVENYLNDTNVLFDLKAFWDRNKVDGRL